MAEYKGLDLLDYLIFVVKWKRSLLTAFFISLVMAYLFVYFFIPVKYDSEALIVSADNESFSPIGALSKSLSGSPLSAFGLGGLSVSDKYDLFNTIIYSRSNLDEMIHKFDLTKEYKNEEVQQVRKILKKNIQTEVTDNNAFRITVSAGSPEKAAEMTNYLVDKVNESVIELNVKKSKNNREFLEARYNEIKTNLSLAEDSMKNFQEKNNFYEAESQSKAVIETYLGLESELTTKQIELSIIKEVVGKNSPQANNLETTVDEFQKKLNSIKNNKNDFLAINNLPENAMKFLRIKRQIEIYNSILEFLIPMYEQARFEEVKNVPVLQVIDYGTPPEKKSYPPRILFSLLISLFIVSVVYIIRVLRELLLNTPNSKLIFIRQNIFKFKI